MGNHVSRGRAATLTLALTAIMSVACATPAGAAYPGASGAIAWQVFSADPNGSLSDSIQTAAGTVTGCDSRGGTLACDFGRVGYSPDGTMLVVARQVPVPGALGHGDLGSLMLVGAGGSGAHNLPRQTADDEEPAFVPSGTAVVFTGTTSGTRNLFSVNTDGSGLRQLTTGGGSWPAPCANGTIAFVRSGNLYLLEQDQRTVRRLTFRGGLNPSCSPDGRTIAFVRRGALYTIGAGGAPMRHIPTPHPAIYPAYAPTGHAIAYETGYDVADGSNSELDVVNLQGRPALRYFLAATIAGTYGEDTAQGQAGAIDWQPATPSPPPPINVGLVGGSPFASGAGAGAATCSVAFSPDGTLLATANTRGFGGSGCTALGAGGGSVSVLSVGRTGTLRAVRGSPFVTGKNLDTRSVAFAPSGRLLAVAVNRIGTSKRSIMLLGSGVAVFSVSRSGTLRWVRGSPFANGGRSVAEALAFSPDGKLLAVANDTGTVSMFTVGRSGGLVAVHGSPFRTGSAHPAGSIVFSPTGRFLARADDDGTVSMLSVNAATGALKPVVGSPFKGGGFSLAFSPDGRLLATAGGGLSVFAVDQSTGSLSQVPNPPSYGFSPAGVAFNRSGSLLAAPSSGFGGVALFSVHAAGSLTPVPGLPWMPNSMFSTGSDNPGSGGAFDRSGHLLALPERGSGVSVLTIH
jgi:Tol biopolymer transport system component